LSRTALVYHRGARAYADRHGLVYVEGAELLARFC
jgi:hypothetical protein